MPTMCTSGNAQYSVSDLDDPAFNGVQVRPARFNVRSERYEVAFTFYDLQGVASADHLVVVARAMDIWGNATAARPDHVWPISGTATPDFDAYGIASTFGPRLRASEDFRYQFHRGIDVPCDCYTPVHASAGGVIRLAGDYSFYADRLVQIRHYKPWADGSCMNAAGESGGCYYSNYMNLASVAVNPATGAPYREGDPVSVGAIIGYSGETGIGASGVCNAGTGGFDHLHFEIRDAGVFQRDAIHPLVVLPYPDTGASTLQVDRPHVDATDPLRPVVDVTVALPQSAELDLARVEVAVYDSASGAPQLVDQHAFDVHEWNAQYSLIELDNPDFNGIHIGPAIFNARSEIYQVAFTFVDLQGVASADHLVVVVRAMDIWGNATEARYEPAPQDPPPPGPALVVVAGGPYSGDEGSPIPFDGSLSSDSDGSIVSYEWDFDYDGVSFDVDATGSNPSHTYADDGTLTAALRVTAADGATAIDTASVTVDNVDPSADAGGPHAGVEGSPITFGGSASDPGADVLTYQWDFDYDGVSFDVDATGSNPSHTYADDGTFTAALRVTDDDGATAIDTASVTVDNVDPSADAGGPYAGVEGSPITFGGIASDPGADILTYQWDFDYDGVSFDVDASGVDLTGPQPTYAAAGGYTAALRVRDDDGGISPISTADVTIDPSGPRPLAHDDFECGGWNCYPRRPRQLAGSVEPGRRLLRRGALEPGAAR